MIIKTVKVSEKGQIAIPLEIREEAKISKGDELIIMQDGKRILIEPAKEVSKQMEDDFSDLLRISEKSLMKLWNNKKDEVWDKHLKK